ncbi:MAG: hypothetical protein H6Q35_2733 [Proteobacteria bacterium]|nr:hypothetical protein [Pseudomonadota bacterium]
MKSRFADIDNAIKAYIADEISMEKNKELEELVFFSSYTIKFDVFKKATQKLKKILRQKLPYEWHVWKVDAARVIEKYHLDVSYESERYTYLLQALLKAQIKINEAVMGHFIGLCKKAHSFEYIESRAEQIYKLLFDDMGKENVCKTSSLL